MAPINSFLDTCRSSVKTLMHQLAKLLNRVFGKRVTPNGITIIGFLMHIPISWLIAVGSFIPAALLLVIFGLFDSLDGALARLQKRDSAAGMLLDASTDRMKEVLLYSGACYNIALINPPMAAWAVAACGASLCVSYVKAKGETAVAKSGLSVSEVNKLFQDGLLRFEVRMALLVTGLLVNQLLAVVIIIAILSTFTALQRLVAISKKLA